MTEDLKNVLKESFIKTIGEDIDHYVRIILEADLKGDGKITIPNHNTYRVPLVKNLCNAGILKFYMQTPDYMSCIYEITDLGRDLAKKIKLEKKDIRTLVMEQLRERNGIALCY